MRHGIGSEGHQEDRARDIDLQFESQAGQEQGVGTEKAARRIFHQECFEVHFSVMDCLEDACST